MAKLNSYIDIDFNSQSLLYVKIFPLTTTARAALTPGLGDAGLAVYDTDLNQLFFWSGTAWVSGAPAAVSGGLVFKGGLTAAATAPAAPEVGWLYVFTSAGALDVSWSPLTDVTVGDQALWDGTAWLYVQGNAVTSSETVEGLIQIATQAEVDAGAVEKAVTPLKLASYVPSSALTRRIARRYETLIVALAANTPETVTHNLALAAASSLTVSCFVALEEVLLKIQPVDANSFTVSSNVALANVTVVAVG